MNSMLPAIAAGLDDVRAMPGQVEQLRTAVTFQAWRVQTAEAGNVRHEARPVELPDWVQSEDEAAQVACSCLLHKGAIMVLRTDAAMRPERRHLLSVFQVKKRSRPEWVRGPDGQSVRAPDEYPDFVMQVCVREGFDPVEPWKMADGNPVGADLTLVES